MLHQGMESIYQHAAIIKMPIYKKQFQKKTFREDNLLKYWEIKKICLLPIPIRQVWIYAPDHFVMRVQCSLNVSPIWVPNTDWASSQPFADRRHSIQTEEPLANLQILLVASYPIVSNPHSCSPYKLLAL